MQMNLREVFVNLREVFTNLNKVFANLREQFAKLRKVFFASYCIRIFFCDKYQIFEYFGIIMNLSSCCDAFNMPHYYNREIK